MASITEFCVATVTALTDIFTSKNNRWFLGYMATSVLLAYAIYWVQARKDPELREHGFIPFAFPKDIWKHRGTKVDILYFFFNKALFIVAIGSMFVMSELSEGGMNVIFELLSLPPSLVPQTPTWIILFVTTSVMILAYDFTLWFAHTIFHKIPVLWEFHKVHHSAEVMTPFTAGRMHPVEEFAGSAMTGLTVGATYAVVDRLFGNALVIQLFQVNIVLFMFYMLGFHLRHSHVWLPYTGLMGKIFVSPAHHQLHHSIDREHWDRNMGFIFAFWDRMFGTLVVPEREMKIAFGVNGVEERDYDSVWKLYSVPFIKAWRLVQGKRQSMDPMPSKQLHQATVSGVIEH